MCGRFAMDQGTNELIEEFVAQGNDFRDWRPQFSIAPTNTIPVVREREHDGEISRTVEPAVWDFWPQWMEAGKKKKPLFNSRIETVATNGLWKRAFESTRCIVPMRGYYEWTGEAGDKQPHFIHGPGALLAAAGIYTARKDDAGDWYLTVSIITRAARDASGELHDRMPAFLSPALYDDWLSPAGVSSAAERERLLNELEHVSGEQAAAITSYPVDKRLSRMRSIDPQDPTLIDPMTL